MAKKADPKEVELRIQKSRPYISLDYSTYQNRLSKCRWIDAEYGEFWAKPRDLYLGKGHRDRFYKGNIVPVGEIAARVTEIHPNTRLDESTYVDTHTSARFVDDEYGEFWARPSNVINNKMRHPKRAKFEAGKLRPEDVEARAKSDRPFISLDYATFVNTHTRCRWVDSEYGEWWATPAHVTHGESCHPARSGAVRFTADTIAEKIAQKDHRLTIDKTTFKNVSSPAKFIDCEFGEFWTKPYYILAGYGRHPRRVTTRLEEKVSSLLSLPVYNKVPEFFKDEVVKPDFKLNDKVFLDVDGLYWHSEIHKEPKHHKLRREIFEKHGRRLLQFREDEIRDKPDIVKSIIANVLGQTPRKVFARKTKLIHQVPAEFFMENHLMGFAPGKAMGLQYGEQIVCAMSYRISKQELHVVRFCNLVGHTIVGGFSKLLRAIVESCNFSGTIINFVDLRYGTGAHLLEKGFHLHSISLGWSWTDTINTFNRLQCRANMDNRKLSQSEQAAEFGWVRIYDAGQAKYIRIV